MVDIRRVDVCTSARMRHALLPRTAPRGCVPSTPPKAI